MSPRVLPILPLVVLQARAIRDAKDSRGPEPIPKQGDESRFRWATKFYQVWDMRLEIAIEVIQRSRHRRRKGRRQKDVRDRTHTYAD